MVDHKKIHKSGHNPHAHKHHAGHSHKHTPAVHHKPHVVRRKRTKKHHMSIGVAVLIIAAIVLLFAYFGGPKAPTETVKLDFYIMSQCPYGTQVEDAIQPVLKTLGDSVEFNLNFITSPSTYYAGKEDQYCVEDVCSMHRIPEVEGDIVQLCAVKYAPENYMDMIVCMNKEMGSIPSNWEACAEEAGIPTSKIKKCFEGEEGLTLLRESSAKAEEVSATGSPTIYLNDEKYSGGRDSLSFQRSLCQLLDGHPECESMPECGSDTDCTAEADKIGTCENPGEKEANCVYTDAVKFEVVVVSDKNCASCDSSRIVATNEQFFKGAKHRFIDISSTEGKELKEKMNIVYVPAYIFDAEVVESASWKTNSRIAPAFDEIDDKFKLKPEATGASYIVDDEIRAQRDEAIGISRGDNTPQIDFFVMSYCPYGNQAEEGIEPVYQLLGDKAEFKPHYVIYSNYQGGGPDFCIDEESVYCSMHGIQELNQNIREHCANKYYGIDKWFEFALAMNTECNYQNADTCWEGVASGLGIDTAKIAECQTSEGLEFAKQDKVLGDLLGVSGSPSVFVDGESYNGGRTPDSYLAGLCAAFDTVPEECKESLAAAAPAAAPAAGSCG